MLQSQSQGPVQYVNGNEEVRLYRTGSVVNKSPNRQDEGRFSCKIELGGTQQDEEFLPLFSLSSVEAATDSFAPSNKLGEGGFGAVYKARAFKLILMWHTYPHNITT